MFRFRLAYGLVRSARTARDVSLLAEIWPDLTVNVLRTLREREKIDELVLVKSVRRVSPSPVVPLSPIRLP